VVGPKNCFCFVGRLFSVFVEFFAWRSINSSLAAGNYSMHDFYVEVLNLLNVSADLVCPALNNVLLVSTSASASVQSVSVLVLVSADPVLITSLVVITALKALQQNNANPEHAAYSFVRG
jgi:hypothetical protein